MGIGIVFRWTFLTKIIGLQLRKYITETYLAAVVFQYALTYKVVVIRSIVYILLYG